MVQGDGSQYPILPITFSIIVFCYLMSMAVSIAVDYLYDFYLVRIARVPESELIVRRIKGDLKRMRAVFQPSKLEKFDPDAAKQRLSIIRKFTVENSDQNPANKQIDTHKSELKLINEKPEQTKEVVEVEEPKTKPRIKQEADKKNDDSKEQAAKIETIKVKVEAKQSEPNSSDIEKSVAINEHEQIAQEDETKTKSIKSQAKHINESNESKKDALKSTKVESKSEEQAAYTKSGSNSNENNTKVTVQNNNHVKQEVKESKLDMEKNDSKSAVKSAEKNKQLPQEVKVEQENEPVESKPVGHDEIKQTEKENAQKKNNKTGKETRTSKAKIELVKENKNSREKIDANNKQADKEEQKAKLLSNQSNRSSPENDLFVMKQTPAKDSQPSKEEIKEDEMHARLC
jgi:hypothetical protein